MTYTKPELNQLGTADLVVLGVAGANELIDTVYDPFTGDPGAEFEA